MPSWSAYPRDCSLRLVKRQSTVNPIPLAAELISGMGERSSPKTTNSWVSLSVAHEILSLLITDWTGTAFENIKGRLYPAVCFSVETLGASITANFGDDPNKKFKYENWNDEKNTLGPLSKNVDKRRDKVYVMSPTYEV